MEIGGDLRNNLATLIADEVNIAERYEGRDVLLTGINNQNGWTRDPNNKRIDISTIIKYLTRYFEGSKETIGTWGLIIFIDNAIRQVKGTVTEGKLQKLRQQCIHCWEQEHQESPQLTVQSSAHHNEPSLPFSSLEQAPIPNTPPSPEKSEYSGKEAYSRFFENASSYVIEAQKAIAGAYRPFKELALGNAEPVERREALDHLTNSLEQLRSLLDLLRATSPLPNTMLAQYRRRFLENIQYLIEQIQKLMKSIEQNVATNTVKEKFFTIEQALQVFDCFHQEKESSSDANR